MEKLKKYFRKLARLCFRKWIKVYQHSHTLSSIDIVATEDSIRLQKEIKWKIARSFAEKMLEDGLIDFEEEICPQTGNRIIRTKIRII